MIVSAQNGRAVALSDNGAFVEVNIKPPTGLATLKVWAGTAGPIITKTLTKQDADLQKAFDLYNDLLHRVPERVFALE